ncbi:hypothetical protein [Amycolatopsis sp. H20-H5]|uniref:hypothetical protein n=1 Tax=Amycolatopsis sp. H20-H5 TaxID=3046309 RepID=UPI002DBF11A1|nr:hypothetical protein [Amycolatopsis sp. H20-H5]MEC3974857.1 hypothetical protein [Amycolatopsis sp. H20-H5]
MASHEVDRVLDDIDATLRQLKDAMRGIPARREGFAGLHDRVAKTAALLSVSLSDARAAVT